MSRRRPGAEEEAHYVGNWQRPLDPGEPLRAKIEAAAAVNLLRPDSDLPGCTIENTRIVAPDARTAGVAREALAAAHIEAEVVETAAVPEPATDRSPQKPRKRRSTRKRPVGPADDDPPAPAAAAKQVPPSKPSPRSTVARNRSAIAWANDNPAEADRLLRPNAAAVLDLLAPDAEQAHGDEFRDLLDPAAGPTFWGALYAGLYAGKAAASPNPGAVHDAVTEWGAKVKERRSRLLYLLGLLSSTVDAADGAPLSVLAAARERLGPDLRETGIIPSAPPRVCVVEAPEDRESLPDLLPDPEPEARQLILPELPAPAPSIGGRAPWLSVYDDLGGNSMAAGTGRVALDLRLWFEALGWAPPAARWGRLVDVPLTLRDLRAALWPNGWQRGRDLPKLRDAMRQINALGFLMLPRAELEWAPVLWRAIPGLGANLDTTALLQIQLPPSIGGGAGARYCRETLRRLGLGRSAAYRAYLGLVHEWDRCGRRGLPPPAWRGLGRTDRRRLIFGPDATTNSPTTRRTRQLRADRAFEDLAAAGVIDLTRDPADPQIWRPDRRDLPTREH